MKKLLLLSLILIAAFVAPSQANFIAPTTSATGTYTIDWTFSATGSCNSGSYTYPYRIQELNSSGQILRDEGLQSKPYNVTSKPGGSYTYKLWTYLCSTSGNGYYYRGSVTVQVGPSTPSAPPTFQAALTGTSVLLTWTKPAEPFTYYEIQRNGITITTAPYHTAVSYTDSAPVMGSNTYNIRACTTSAAGCSVWKASNVIITGAPSAPSSFQASFSYPNVSLTWTKPAESFTYYVIERNGVTIAGPYHTETSYTDTNPVQGVNSYRIRACTTTSAGCSVWKNSNTISVVGPADDSIDPTDDPKLGELYTGFIWGEHSVNNTGAFNYNIPIDIPDGVNGLQPDVGIGYSSSNSKNGLLGWGWGLKAGSGIGRCHADIARDGYRSGINAGEKYKFCLDGTRLVEVADREYRTELETFSRIRSYGGTSLAPDSWVVEFKNGRKATYDALNSAVDGQGSKRFWYISQLEDTFGNKIKYAYTKGTTPHGAITAVWTLLESISYDYSDNLIPNKIITFGYEARSDAHFEYVAGSLIAMPSILNAINIHVNGTMIKTYALEYERDNSSHISRLARVRKCSRFDGISWQCVPVKEIDWNQERALAFTGKISKPYYGSADFNGDGKLDTLSIVKVGDQYTIRVKPYGSSGSGDIWLTTTSDKLGARPSFYDFDKDGYDDVVFEGSSAKSISFCYRILKSTGASFNNISTLSCPHSELLSLPALYGGEDRAEGNLLKQYIIDVNGDGHKDILFGNFEKGIFVRLNNGSGGFFSWSKWLSVQDGFMPQGAALWKFGDFNGDGQIDIYNQLDKNVLLNTNGQFEIKQWPLDYNTTDKLVPPIVDDVWSSIRPRAFWVADYNGDGLSDVIYFRESTNEFSVQLSTGNGFSPRSVIHKAVRLHQGTFDFNYQVVAGGSTNTLRVKGEQLSFVDLNKDGCVDMLAISSSTSDELGVKIVALSTCDQTKGYRPFVLLSKDTDAPNADAPVGDDYILNSWGGFSPAKELQVSDLNSDGFLEISDQKYSHILNQPIRLVTAVRDYEFAEGRTVSGSQTREVIIRYDSVTSSIIESYKRSTGGLDSYLESRDRGAYKAENATVSRVPVVSSVAEKIFSGQTSSVLPANLVSELKKEYKYKGYLANTQGWGSLGFAEVSEKTTFGSANPEYLRALTKYYQLLSDDSRLVGVPSLQTLYASENGITEKKISETETRWKIRVYNDDRDNFSQGYLSPHYFPYKLESTTKKYDLTFGTLYSTTINSMYARGTDAWGCGSCMPIEKTSTDAEYTANGALKVSQTIIADDNIAVFQTRVNTRVKSDFKDIVTSSKWVLDLPGLLTETAALVSADSATRTMAYTYTSAGQVHTETVEPNKPALYVKTTYSYNTRGTRNSQVSTWNTSANDGLAYGNSRQSRLVETRNGNPTFTTTDFSGLSSVAEFSAVTGKRVRLTDANGRSEYNTYDMLGRETSETLPGNVVTTTDYRRCDNCFPYNLQAEWYSAGKTTGSSAVHTYYDAQDREVGTRTKGLNGQFIYTYKTYNHRGQLKEVTAPFYAGETPKVVSYTYDVLGRKTKVTYPDLTVDAHTYFGLEERFTNRENQKNTKLVNGLGWTLKKWGNDNRSVEFTYWPFGELKTTLVDSISKTQVFYDDLGRKTRLIDPSSGTTQYTYNSLGLLSSETDANGIVTRYGYDKSDRVVSRTDNALGAAKQHTWIFDNKYDGKGSLGSVIGVDTDGIAYKEEYEYNANGQIRQQRKQIKGNTYTTTSHYDRFSRPYALTYPSGFVVKKGRNSYGHVDRVINDKTAQVLWKAQDADAQGNLKQLEYGNGVLTTKTYDSNYGRVKTIKAQKGSFYIQNQEFAFTPLGNFKTKKDYRVNSTESFCYDLMNRLEECNDLTRNEYSNSGNITKKGGNTYTYEPARPHAVKTALGNTYTYDAAGQMLSGAGRTIQYTTFGTPSFISRNGAQINLAYGSTKNRIYRYDSSTATTVTYVNLGEYEVSTANNVTTRVHYLGDFAQYISRLNATTGEPINDYMVYLHRDHLGSIVAESDSTASATTNINWRGFDPWGKPGSALGITSRGYTDHEHLVSVGLIHMNGRVFDPELGRFLTPDPIIQAPENTQSYNRYSYVFNNPMSFTDPTGYQASELEFLTVIGTPPQPLTIDSLNGLMVVSIPGADLQNALISSLSGNYANGTISPIEGNATLGAVAIILEDATFGIIWGDTSSILMLRSSPQIEANKEAARRGSAGPLLKVLPLVGMVTAGGGVKTIAKLEGALAAKGLLGNQMYRNAISLYKSSDLTNVGRALTKHPEVVGASKDTLRQSLKSDASINSAAADALKNIMRNGVESASTHPRYGDIVTYQISNGFGARFNAATNEFIGFINP